MNSPAACAARALSASFLQWHPLPAEYIAFSAAGGQCFTCSAEQAAHAKRSSGYDIFDVSMFVSAGWAGQGSRATASRQAREGAYGCLQARLDAHCFHALHIGTVARRAAPGGAWACVPAVDTSRVGKTCVSPSGSAAYCASAAAAAPLNATEARELEQLVAEGCAQPPGSAARAAAARVEPPAAAAGGRAPGQFLPELGLVACALAAALALVALVRHRRHGSVGGDLPEATAAGAAGPAAVLQLI